MLIKIEHVNGRYPVYHKDGVSDPLMNIPEKGSVFNSPRIDKMSVEQKREFIRSNRDQIYAWLESGHSYDKVGEFLGFPGNTIRIHVRRWKSENNA